jgi:hypothetical protein
MIALKIVYLIEKNADHLAKQLIQTVHKHPQTQTFIKNVPREELHERAYEIYRNLSTWLVEKTDNDIRIKYYALGERRAGQQVPLHEVIHALLLVKQNLWKEVKASGFGENAVELFQALELADLVNQFFDKSIYYMVAGYEHACISGKVDLGALGKKAPQEFNNLRHLVLPWWP